MITPIRKSYGLAAMLSLGLAAASQGAAAGCVYKISNEWNTGLTGEIVITNSGTSAVSGWNVGWQYATNRVTSSWNVTLSGSNPYTASNLGWNGTLQPGQSATFGFQVDKRGGSAEVPTITGSICSGTAASSVAPSSVPTTSSSSSKPVVVSSSSSSSLINNGGQQCNWYGTLYPLCVTTQSGWGWENNKSCIARSTCLNVVGGSASSAAPSSSSVPTTSSSVGITSTSRSSSSSSSVATTSSVTPSSSSVPTTSSSVPTTSS